MPTAPNYKRTKLACYTAYFTMSSVFSLPPLLFVTLHELYDISYTLLGTLVLTNFCTQLMIDLLFTFFSKHFNVAKIVRIMPMRSSGKSTALSASAILRSLAALRKERFLCPA